MKQNNYPVFNINLAKHLLHCGFLMVDLNTNKNCKNKIVFYFKETDLLIQEIKHYQELYNLLHI